MGMLYTTEENFKPTLILNNKGPHPIVVTPILSAAKENRTKMSLSTQYFSRLLRVLHK